MKRWYCTKCEEFPDGIVHVLNEHRDDYYWDAKLKSYEFDECADGGDLIRVECVSGHVVKQREFAPPPKDV